MLKYYLFTIIATIFGAFGAYFLKMASDTKKSLIKLIFFEPKFYVGGILYFLSSLISIFVLKFLPYGIAYFFTSLTYLWSFLIGIFLLNEKFTLNKLINLILIICGIVIITL